MWRAYHINAPTRIVNSIQQIRTFANIGGLNYKIYEAFVEFRRTKKSVVFINLLKLRFCPSNFRCQYVRGCSFSGIPF
jgi:hypothetical protein